MIESNKEMNLKCCGNCEYYEHQGTSYCNYKRPSNKNSFECCPDWKYDGIKYSDRVLDFTDWYLRVKGVGDE